MPQKIDSSSKFSSKLLHRFGIWNNLAFFQSRMDALGIFHSFIFWGDLPRRRNAYLHIQKSLHKKTVGAITSRVLFCNVCMDVLAPYMKSLHILDLLVEVILVKLTFERSEM